MGWRVRAQVPADPRYVLIGAPHTTNWDLVISLLMAGTLGLRLRWVGKSSLFRFPQGVLMRWLGGIPVQRGAKQGAVRRLAELIQQQERFVLAIAPEGTRSQDPYWKTGFYHIARAACVPVALGYCDYPARTVGIGPTISPTGDLREDFKRMARFYAEKRGKFPHKQNKPELDPRPFDDEPSPNPPVSTERAPS